jgi:hypothetical protein
LRQLQRAVDLGFPEFTRYVRTLESQFATMILSRYPTAALFRGVSVKKLARIVYDGSHKIGEELAHALIEAAERYEARLNDQDIGAIHPVRSDCRSSTGFRSDLLGLQFELQYRNAIAQRYPLSIGIAWLVSLENDEHGVRRRDRESNRLVQ